MPCYIFLRCLNNAIPAINNGMTMIGSGISFGSPGVGGNIMTISLLPSSMRPWLMSSPCASNTIWSNVVPSYDNRILSPKRLSLKPACRSFVPLYCSGSPYAHISRKPSPGIVTFPEWSSRHCCRIIRRLIDLSPVWPDCIVRTSLSGCHPPDRR